MTPTEQQQYNLLCQEQGKCWKRLSEIESEKLALVSEHRGWKDVFGR